MFRTLPIVVLLALLPFSALAEGGIGETTMVARGQDDGAPKPLTLSAADRADLERIEAYFNAMPTVQAKFIQRAQQMNGGVGVATGTFKLWRPGRLRIDYDSKFGDFIVADGYNLYSWDGEMQSQSQTGIDDGLAGVILRKDFSLSRDVTVTRVAHPDPQHMEVALRSASDPGAGELTLVLHTAPLGLVSWRIVDGQGLTTAVDLMDVKQGVTFDRRDFSFRRPEPTKRGVK